MESLGFFKATHADKKVNSIVIRGISDLFDDKAESDIKGFQTLAARNAAVFAFAPISQYYSNKK
jgi:nucleoside phosphorylase